MNQTAGFSLNRYNYLTVLILSALVAIYAMEGFIFPLYETKLIQEVKVSAADELAGKAAALSAAVHRRFAIMQGVIVFKETLQDEQLMERHFEKFAQELVSTTNGIHVITLSPGGINRMVYPIKGNENILGYNVLANPRPEQQPALQRTLESRQVVLNGPYALKQGGFGLVARRALYQQDELWGLAVVIIDIPILLTEAGLDTPSEHLDFALQNSEIGVFGGSPAVFENDPIIIHVPLPEGEWLLGGSPRHSWHQLVSPSLRLVKGLGYTCLFLMLWLLYTILRQRDYLTRTVAQRTNELQQKTAELNTAVERLQVINAELEQFAYVTSHDLKAPLRAISNLSQWIEEDTQEQPLSESTREYLSLIRSRTQRMELLINGILQYSRIGRINSPAADIPTAKLLRQTFDELQPLPGDSLDIGPGWPVLTANPVMLSQLFTNLLGNALKYRKPGEPCHIVASATDEGAYYTFSLTDNGIGIDPQFHHKIFGMFQTLVPRDQCESTGVGLTIVQKIIRHYGGEIYVKSQDGCGASFIFTWPKDSPAE